MSPDQASKAVHPLCRRCGFAQGGTDAWDHRGCKCRISSAPIERDIEKIHAAHAARLGGPRPAGG